MQFYLVRLQQAYGLLNLQTQQTCLSWDDLFSLVHHLLLVLHHLHRLFDFRRRNVYLFSCLRRHLAWRLWLCQPCTFVSHQSLLLMAFLLLFSYQFFLFRLSSWRDMLGYLCTAYLFCQHPYQTLRLLQLLLQRPACHLLGVFV